jgi:hypothetical protein
MEFVNENNHTIATENNFNENTNTYTMWSFQLKVGVHVIGRWVGLNKK